MLRHNFMLIVIVVLLVLLTNPVDASAPPASIAWAERRLREANIPPTQWYRGYWVQVDKMFALQAFQSIVAKYGPDGCAYAGLARSQAGLGDYKSTLDSYRAALNLLPGHKNIQYEMQRTQEYALVANYLRSRLRNDANVLQIQKYPADAKHRLWACLSGVKTSGILDGFYPEYSDIRLSIVYKHANKLELLWQSDRLGHSINGGFDYFNVLCLLVVNFTGDRVPQIMIQKTVIGASAAPSHLDIFTLCGDHIVKLIGVTSELPFTYCDYNCDGRYEIISGHSIGYSLAHAEQPYWEDIYVYKDGYYQLADGDFPRQYRALAQEIKQALKRYPNDWELLKYSGIINQIRHRPYSAMHDYKNAENAALSCLATESNLKLKRIISYELADIRRRKLAQ